ncbi:glycosyltransferase family 1 protein [Mesorhizobium australicum]|uniref:glycosyltransferase family 1 protein n=1 Tax=Mesorhizobium australicum TaxID=536018 RepID=UPI00333A5DEE
MARILMIIEARIATTYLLEQLMEACREYGVDHKIKFLNELLVDDITPDVIPMFVRCADPQVLLWTQLLADANRSYIYYIDDNFWRISGDNALAAYYQHPMIRKSLEFAVSHAETVIVNSLELATVVSKFNARVTVLPASFDFSLIENLSPSPTEEIRIGFAGSPSRVDDLNLVSPLIDPILERFPKAVFEFAGVLPTGVQTGARVRFFPHINDYNAYIKFQSSRSWAIGLAPLLDHEANRAKTDNKYREYGAFRIAGIYSNITPYNNVVRNLETGIVVNNDAESWIEAVSFLMESPNKRIEIKNSAFEDVKNRYDVKIVSNQWADKFLEINESSAGKIINLDICSVKRKLFIRKIERSWVSLYVSYREGGARLVFKRILKRVLI